MNDVKTSTQDKAAMVPRLRFPEFRETGEWNFKTLGKLAKRSTRKNADNKVTRVLTNSAEFGVVDQRDFFDKDIANQGNLAGYFIVEKGSYVYNPRTSAHAPVGPISKNRIGLGVMSPLYTVFKLNDEEDDFYAHYFKSTHWHQYMRQASSTGARHDRMSITISDFMKMPLPAPKPEEQQKIADCLSSLDELITTEIQKLDTLKTHKKGLMQQLFPQEGETQPRLRLPEFQNTGKWEWSNLSKLAKFSSGGTPSKKNLGYWNGNIPWISASSMHDVHIYDSALKVTPSAIGNGTRVAPKDSLLVLVRGSMLFRRVL